MSSGVTDETQILVLDDIISKISLDSLGGGPTSETEETQLFDSILKQLSQTIETFDGDIAAQTKTLLTNPDEKAREENQLELVTVFSVVRTIKHIELLLQQQMSTEHARKINALILSFTSLFKYHFQLPNNHNNYAFRNFGKLLTSPRLNIISTFIQYIKISNSSFGELNKAEMVEKTFLVLLIFHCFNPDLFCFLSTSLSKTSLGNEIVQHLNLIPLTSPANIKASSSIPSLSNIYQRFRMSLLLEDSSFATDTRSFNLLNVLFFTSFYKTFLYDLVTNIIKLNIFFQNDMTSESLLDLSSEILICPQLQDYLTLFLAHKTENLIKLDGFVKSENPIQASLKDISMFLLLKSSQNFLENYNNYMIPDKNFLSYLIEYNNPTYTSILGISENQNECELNINTFIPIFELVDQNLKLNYLKERDFLTVLKFSLINLDSNIDTWDDFMNINSLLIDLGCSKSIHALADTLQSLLCLIINNVKFKSLIFNKIPNRYEKILGFDLIPPVYRSDLSFENNIDQHSEFFGFTYKSLQQTENFPTIVENKCLSLLEDSLILVLSIKNKIFDFLKELNMDTNVLRLPDLFVDESKPEENSLNTFKQGISTKIGSFKSCKSLHYKLLNSSITLQLVSNLSLLVLSENYKSLKSVNIFIDNSLSRILSEFTFDFTLNFLIIYQEFGLLSFFKQVRDLNHENLKMIIPSTSLISKLFQIKNQDSKSEKLTTINSQSTNLELISEILYASVIASNSLRQYVELFDDGQSKPFKLLNKFLKAHPSTLKPSKITKGTVTLDFNYYREVLN